MQQEERITREEQLECLERTCSSGATEQDRARIAALAQNDEEWKKERVGRLTGSRSGAAAGHNPYCSHAKLLQEMLFGDFQGNEATRWGQDHEQVALDVYLQWRDDGAVIQRPGLIVHPSMAWLAYSPDGLVVDTTTGQRLLLEVKCPFRKILYREIPMYYFDPRWMPASRWHDVHVTAPSPDGGQKGSRWRTRRFCSFSWESSSCLNKNRKNPQ